MTTVIFSLPCGCRVWDESRREVTWACDEHGGQRWDLRWDRHGHPVFVALELLP